MYSVHTAFLYICRHSHTGWVTERMIQIICYSRDDTFTNVWHIRFVARYKSNENDAEKK